MHIGTARTPQQAAGRGATALSVNWQRAARSGGYDPREKWVQDVSRENKTEQQWLGDVAAAKKKQEQKKAEIGRKQRAVTRERKLARAKTGQPWRISGITSTGEGSATAFDRTVDQVVEQYGLSRERARELVRSGAVPVSRKPRTYTASYQVEGRPAEKTTGLPSRGFAQTAVKAGLQAQDASVSPEERARARRQLLAEGLDPLGRLRDLLAELAG
jgi:hypothetical protein